LDFFWGKSIITVCEFYELNCECVVGFLWWCCIIWMVVDA
jgi:hypothetical protein